MSHLTISRTIAALVVVSAIIVPAASAQPIDSPGVAPAIENQSHAGVQPATSQASTAPSRGFDWDDAAVGAAATVILLSVGVASVVAVRRGRARSNPLLG